MNLEELLAQPNHTALCIQCGKIYDQLTWTGRPHKYCTTKCRKQAQYQRVKKTFNKTTTQRRQAQRAQQQARAKKK